MKQGECIMNYRMNHAVADGYLIAGVFRLLEKELSAFISERTA